MRRRKQARQSKQVKDTVTVNGIEVREDREWRYLDLGRFSMYDVMEHSRPGPQDYAINEDGIVCHIPTETFYAPKTGRPDFTYVDGKRFITAWLLAKAFEVPQPWYTAHAVFNDPSKPVHISNVVWMRGRFQRHDRQTAQTSNAA